MSSTKDGDRRRAFKVIVDDIEADRDRYRNVPSQVARIAELIDSHNLKLRPKRGEVQTPTARFLRDALTNYMRKRNPNPAAGPAVFTDGMRVLTQEQKRELGYPEEVGIEATSSSRDQGPAAQRKAPDAAYLVHAEHSNSARQQQLPGMSEGELKGNRRLSALPIDDSALPRPTSTALGVQSPRSPSQGTANQPHQSPLKSLGNSQAKSIMAHQDRAPKAKTDTLRGTEDIQSVSSLPEKRGIKRKQEYGPGDGRPSKKSQSGSGREHATGKVPSSEMDESISAYRGTKRKHEATHGDDRPSKRSVNNLGPESGEYAANPSGDITNMLAQPGRDEPAAVAVSAGELDLPPGYPQASRGNAATLTATQSHGNGLKGASYLQPGPQSAPQTSTLKLANITTCFEFEPVDQTEIESGSDNGPAQYPDGLNRVKDIAKETEHIAIGIESATDYLLKSSGMQDMRASIPTTPCNDLEELYRRILCSPELPWQPKATGVLNTNLSLEEWLSAGVGAMIYEQVFLQPVPWRTPRQLLEDMKYAKPWFSRILRTLYDPKHQYQHLDYYVWRTGEQQIEENSPFEAEHVTPIAERLAGRCMMLVVQQMRLAKPGVKIPDAALERAMDEYTTLFKKAIFLRGRCEVAPTDFEYVWPAPRAPFSLASMRESRGRNKNAKDVQIALFPAIRALNKAGLGFTYFAKAQVFCNLNPTVQLAHGSVAQAD